MNTIAKLKVEDRKFVFLKASEAKGKTVSIIEKDYWVCYLLDYLFTKSEFKDMLVSKGGTSLSKCYKIIDRFSEDIDLTLVSNTYTNSDRKKLKILIIDLCNDLKLRIDNINSIRSRRNFNNGWGE